MSFFDNNSFGSSSNTSSSWQPWQPSTSSGNTSFGTQFNGLTYSQQVPSNIYDAPNGVYGAPRLGICDHLCGSTNSEHVPSGPNYEVRDKCIIQRNENGYNATYDKETGTWHGWMG